MKTSDKLISVLILGLLAPVLLALLFWWGGYIIDSGLDKGFMILIIAGAAVGVLLDLTVLRRFISSLFMLPLAALFIIEIFYSVLIYGFFMGFPVFNSLAGIAGSYIVVRKSIIADNTSDVIKRNFKKAAIFSFLLLLFFCICSAVLALGEPSICSQIQSMLSLPNSVEIWMIWLLVTCGGAFLLVFQYAVSKHIYKAMTKKAGSVT